eukprot:Nitzschia sp. Nitz4//scaffold22_size323478//148503//153026//NITZ4_000536-RA/size323478-augustus-gene-0.127-mRNA-1//1//CDS//3329543022//4722//frame0
MADTLGQQRSFPRRKFGTSLSSNVLRTQQETQQHHHALKKVKVRRSNHTPTASGTTTTASSVTTREETSIQVVRASRTITEVQPFQEQSITFRPGPVGLQLEAPSEQSAHADYPARIVRFVDGGPKQPGQARKAASIQPGDYVVRAEASHAVGTTYDEIIDILKRSHQVRELTFVSAWGGHSRLEQSPASRQAPPLALSNQSSTHQPSTGSQTKALPPTLNEICNESGERQHTGLTPLSQTDTSSSTLQQVPSTYQSFKSISTKEPNVVSYEEETIEFNIVQDTVAASQSFAPPSHRNLLDSESHASTDQDVSSCFTFPSPKRANIGQQQHQTTCTNHQGSTSHNASKGGAQQAHSSFVHEHYDQESRATNQQLQESMDQLLEENEFLRQDFEKRLDHARQEHAKTERELKDLYSSMVKQRDDRIRELEAATDSMKQAMAKFHSMRKEDVPSMKEFQLLEKRLAQAEATLASKSMQLEKQKSVATAKEQELNAEIVDLQLENASLNEDAMHLRMQWEMSQSLLDDMSQSRDTLQPADFDFGSMLQEASRINESTDGEAFTESSMQQISSSEKRLYQQFIGKLVRDLKDSHEHHMSAKKALESLKQSSKEQQKQHQKTISSLEAKIRAKDAALHSQSAAVRKIQSENQQLASKVDTMTSKMDELKYEMTNMENENIQKESDLSEARGDLESMHTKLLELVENQESGGKAQDRILDMNKLVLSNQLLKERLVETLNSSYQAVKRVVELEAKTDETSSESKLSLEKIQRQASEIDAMKAVIGSHKQQQATSSDEVIRLQKLVEASQKREQLASTDSRKRLAHLAAKEAVVGKLRSTLRLRDGTVSQKESEIGNLKEVNQTLKQQVTSISGELSKNEAEFERLHGQIQRLEEEAATSASESMSLKLEMSDLVNASEAATTARMALKEERQAHLEDIQSLHSEADKLMASNVALKETNVELAESNEGLATDLQVRSEELLLAKERLAQLEMTRNALRGELEDKVKSTTEALSEMHTLHETLQAEKVDLQDLLTTVEMENKLMATKYASTRRQLDQVDNVRLGMEDKLSVSENTCQHLGQAIANLEAERLSMMLAIDEAEHREQVAAVKIKEYEKASRQLQRELEEKSTTIQRLQEADVAKEKLHKLQLANAIQDHNAQSSSQLKLVATLRGEVDNLVENMLQCDDEQFLLDDTNSALERLHLSEVFNRETAYRVENNRLKLAVDAMKEEVSAVTLDGAELKRAQQHGQEVIIGLNSELEAANSTIADLEQGHQELEWDICRLYTLLEEKEDEVTYYLSTIDSLSQNLADQLEVTVAREDEITLLRSVLDIEASLHNEVSNLKYGSPNTMSNPDTSGIEDQQSESVQKNFYGQLMSRVLLELHQRNTDKFDDMQQNMDFTLQKSKDSLVELHGEVERLAKLNSDLSTDMKNRQFEAARKECLLQACIQAWHHQSEAE